MQALIPHGGTVQVGQVDEPEPGPDEALVDVKAFSINRGETYQLERPRAGWRPGKDVAGVVIRPAADGTGPRAGERVVAHADDAGWAERAAIPTHRLATLHDTIDFQTAAALPLAGLTALRLTRVTGPLASRRVLLTGASGGVGHYFVELAAAHGARVTAISRRGERLRELGAVEVLPDIAQAHGPFDIALDSVGGAETIAAWHLLQQHGLLIWLGQASREPMRLDYFDWDGAMSVSIRKFDYMDSTTTEAEDLATLVRLVEHGRLHPEIGRVEDWSNAAAAIDALLGRQVRGNLVLTIGDVVRPAGQADGKTVIERYVAALNAGDSTTVADSFAEDAVWKLDGDLPISGTWEGRDAILNGFFATAGTLLDPTSTHVTVTRILSEGDDVVLEWTSRARTTNGDPYENHCIGIFTIANGKIKAVREYMDTAYAQQQFRIPAVVSGQ
jgi:uncharacterized protein (TIGR02246 family)